MYLRWLVCLSVYEQNCCKRGLIFRNFWKGSRQHSGGTDSALQTI